MAYSPVPTVVTGDSWSGANANTYWRDNFAAGIPGMFTAKGDMAYASAANSASVLKIGTKRQVLNVASGVPAWGNPLIGCDIWRTTKQTFPANTLTKIQFDTEKFDTDSMWSSAAKDTINIPYTGFWKFILYISWPTAESVNKILFEDTIVSSLNWVFNQSVCWVTQKNAGTTYYVNIRSSQASPSVEIAHFQAIYLGA